MRMFDATAFDIAGIKFTPIERSLQSEHLRAKRSPYTLDLWLDTFKSSVEVSVFEGRSLVYSRVEYHDVADVLTRFTSSASAMAGASGQEFHETQEKALEALKAHAEGFFLEALESWAEWMTWKKLASRDGG